MGFFGKYMTEVYQRITRVEEKVDNLQGDVEEIKDSVKGLKKMIVIVAASSSLVGNASLVDVKDFLSNHFNSTDELAIKEFNQVDETYTIKTKEIADYDDSKGFTTN